MNASKVFCETKTEENQLSAQEIEKIIILIIIHTFVEVFKN